MNFSKNWKFSSYFIIFAIAGSVYWFSKRIKVNHTKILSENNLSSLQELSPSADLKKQSHSSQSPKKQTVLNSQTQFNTDLSSIKILSSEISNFKDTRIDFSQRIEKIKNLGLQYNDPKALRLLMVVGDEKALINSYAVKALTKFKGQIVEGYLKSKIVNSDIHVTRAAIQSYSEVAGINAAPFLVDLLAKNKARSDGHENQIRIEIVSALGDIGSSVIISPLTAELKPASSAHFNLEYGSAIVSALGKTRNPDSLRAIEKYIYDLQEKKPEDALAKAFIQSKIVEANRIVERK